MKGLPRISVFRNLRLPHLRPPQIAIAALVLVAVVAIAIGLRLHWAAAPTHKPRPAPARPRVALARNPLNGLLVLPRSLSHRVAAVMIDNYPVDARPQSGLRLADIVYEVEAEGGITRYMALYLANMPDEIGPVRSARLYFVDLARPYDPFYAHAGENDDVWTPLRQLRAQGFADMEQILGTPEAFWREDSREMPHNLYTSIKRIRSTAKRYGFPDRPFNQRFFAFAKLPLARTAVDPSFVFWNGYTVQYHYARGIYTRVIDGVVQHDREDPRPYRVADVIATWIPAKVIDSVGDLDMQVYGTFPAVLLRGGKTIAGKWIEAGPTALPQLFDLSGRPLALVPGQIYIEILPQGGRLVSGKNVWSY